MDREIRPGPGWVHPERSVSTRERTSEDAVSRAAATEAAQRGEGLHRVHRSGRDAGPSSRRRAVRLRGLAPSTKFVVVRPPLPMTDVRSFHGLCSPSRFSRAAGAFRRCLAGDLRGRSLEGRTRDVRRASAAEAADQRDPSAGSPAASGRSPSSRRHGGGRSPATDRRLFSAAVVAPVSRPRGSTSRSRIHREASARRVCPEHES